jgi:predicted transcriptional regulator
MKTTIKLADTDEFFKRGEEIARLADKGKQVPRERIISFEDPDDLARLITTAKLVLFREVRACPGSITDLSLRLRRDRSAVKRDIDELERFGLVEVEVKPFPGHGRKKEVRAVAEQVLLTM